MLSRLIELLKHNEICENCPITDGCDGCNVYNDLEGQAQYLIDNGVIVPPCELTETVYLSLGETQKVISGIVTGFKITEFSKYTVVYLQNDKRCTEIPFIAFGKTVFLTKEAAEQG